MIIYKINYVADDPEWSKAVDDYKLTEDEFRTRLAKYPASGEQGMMSGVYRHMGWVYDLRDELRRYWVQPSYGDIHEYYAKNRAELERRLCDYYQSDEDEFEPLADYEIVELGHK